MNTNESPATGFIRIDGILQRIPISKSCWWNWVRDGKAPQPIRLGANITVWKSDEIDDLIHRLSEPSMSESHSPRLFGPGPRLDGVSLTAFKKLGSEKQAALVAEWKDRAKTMMTGAGGEQRQHGRRLMNRALAWERQVQRPGAMPARRDARRNLGGTS